MTTTLPLERTDLSILEGLDWDHEPACEHYEHETRRDLHAGPAWALIERLPLPCGCPYRGPALLYVCRSIWEGSGRKGLHCHFCRTIFPRSLAWRFIALVRP